MFTKLFRVGLVSLLFTQNAFAWWGSSNDDPNRYNTRNSYSENNISYNFSSASYQKFDFSSHFTYSSSNNPQFFVPARDSFFSNPIYSSLIEVKQNAHDSDFFAHNIAPNVAVSDVASAKITDGAKFENYSHLAHQYDSFAISNVKQNNEQVESFDRSIARQNWLVPEKVKSITYGADNLPSSVKVEVEDIAGNKMMQQVLNLQYERSPDSDRLRNLKYDARTNRDREGFYGWKELSTQLEDFDDPAQMAAKAFTLHMELPGGNQQDFKFSDVQWNKDRVIGFKVDVEQADKPVQMQVSSALDNEGKIESVKVQTVEGSEKKDFEIKAKDGIQVPEQVLKMFQGINPLQIMGGGTMTIAKAAVPIAEVGLDSAGLLKNATQGLKRDYAIEKDGIFTHGKNELKAQIAQLEQTDKSAVSKEFWNNSLKGLSKTELQSAAEKISQTIEKKLPNFSGMEQIGTVRNETVKSDGQPLKLELKEGKITSPNTFTNESGEKFSNAVFIIDRDEKLKLFQATKTTVDGKTSFVGKKIELPQGATQVIEKAKWTEWSAIKGKIISGFSRIFDTAKELFAFVKTETKTVINNPRQAAQILTQKAVNFESAIKEKIKTVIGTEKKSDVTVKQSAEKELGAIKEYKNQIWNQYKITMTDEKSKWTMQELKLVKKVLDDLPKGFVKTITLQEVIRSDAYWLRGKRDLDTRGGYIPYMKAIKIFDSAMNPGLYQENEHGFLGTFVHELYHSSQYYNEGKNKSYDDPLENGIVQKYIAATEWRWDGNEEKFIPTSHRSKYPTDYSFESTPIEDMAESVMFYYTNSDYLKKNFPNRYEFIKTNVFDGKEFENKWAIK